MPLTADDLESIRQIISQVIKPLEDDVKLLKDDVKLLKDDVKLLKDDVELMKRGMDVMNKRQLNSLKGRMDQLEIVPNKEGQLPTASPNCVCELIVAGNESLPDTNTRNTWNAKKSKRLLLFYGIQDEESEAEDTDAIKPDLARARRLKVAQAVGVSRTQLNYAQLTL